MIAKYFVYLFYTMVLKNLPPGRQKYYFPATAPQYTKPSAVFNTNSYVIVAQKVKQNSNGSSIARRSNVTTTSGGYNTLNPNN